MNNVPAQLGPLNPGQIAAAAMSGGNTLVGGQSNSNLNQGSPNRYVGYTVFTVDLSNIFTDKQYTVQGTAIMVNYASTSGVSVLMSVNDTSGYFHAYPGMSLLRMPIGSFYLTNTTAQAGVTLELIVFNETPSGSNEFIGQG